MKRFLNTKNALIAIAIIIVAVIILAVVKQYFS